MLKQNRSWRRLSHAVLVATALAGSADGATRTWLPLTGDWGVAGNWSGGVVPAGPNDQATIVFSDFLGNRVVNYNVNAAQPLNFLRLSGGVVSGSATVNMPANTFLVNAAQIGIDGQGIFNQTGGFFQTSSGSFTTSGLFLGVNANGRGTFNLSGGNLTVGTSTRAAIGMTGVGTLNLTGGNANFTGNLILGESATGVGRVNLGGTADVRFDPGTILTVGQSGFGVFTQSATSLNVSDLRIGGSSGGAGEYRLTGGNLGISGAASFSSASLYIGATTGATGTFIHSGGNLSVNSPNVGQPGLNVGAFGGAGTYLMSGTAQLSSSNAVRIGQSGAGTFIQTGGIHTGSSVFVGGGGVNAFYSISGNSVLSLSESLLISEGSMVHNGGTVTVGSPASIFGLQQVGQMNVLTSYDFSAGSLSVGGLEILTSLGGSATFTQNGGVHTVEGIYFIGNVGEIAPGAVATYFLNAGRLHVTPSTFETSGGATNTTLNGLQLDTGGVIVGGATDGVFSGKLTLQGGTLAGTFRNDGTIVSRGGFVTGTLLNRRALTLDGGTLTNSLTIQNPNGSIINGAGTISGGVTNTGTISADGAMSINTISNALGSSIYVAPGASLRSSFIDHFTTIRLDQGSLRGSGQVSNNTNQTTGAALISGGGTIEMQIIMNGGIVRADLPGTPLVIQSVGAQVPSSQFQIAPNSTMNFTNAFTNQVTMQLQGSGAQLIGATINNSSIIRGAGEVTNQVVNNGIIRPEGGPLVFTNPNSGNFGAGQIQVGNNAVRFTTGMQLNAGVISLGGGEFDNGAGSMNNAGTFLGRGTIRGGAITNGGTIIFSGGASDVFAPITNNNRINVTGSAVATFYQPVNTSVGTINVNLNSTAVFLANVTGVSHFTGPGVKSFEAGASGGAINSVTGKTIVGPEATLNADFIRDNTLSVVGRASMNSFAISNTVSKVNELLIDGQPNNWLGRLNLNDGGMVIAYDGESPIANVANQIKSGFANGAWTGTGINSSAAAVTANRALGFAEAASIFSSFPATFMGTSISADSVLIRYTIPGDANLDKTVNITDFALLAANFNIASTWSRGDFNYSGTTDIGDFALLAANFNRSLPADLPVLSAVDGPRGASVPEPSLLVALLAAVALLCRCKR